MAGVILRSSDFRAVVEPILNEVYDGVYDQRDKEYNKVFVDANGIPRSYHEEPLLYGFNMAPALPDGQPVTYDQGGVLYSARGYYQVYGTAFAMTKVLVEDGDHVRLGKIYSEHLAQAMVETEETIPANVLNRAFNASYVWGDGSALIVNNHVAAPGAVAAAGDPSRSNLLNNSAALSQTSLEQMLIQMRQAKDPRGKNIKLRAQSLVVAPGNMLQAEVLVKSVLRAGTNNNDLNPVKSMGLIDRVETLSRLTSATAWFIKTDAKQGLRMLWRRRLEKSMEGDFETDSVRYKSTMRVVPFTCDWRTIYGTPGV
jgi:Mu-like prophage major head subunit gpT